jgi:hypothetical protein
MDAGAATARRFPDAMRVRVPPGLRAAVAAAAHRRHQSSPEWVRQTILHRLEADGVRVRDGDVEVTEGHDISTQSAVALQSGGASHMNGGDRTRSCPSP